MNGLKIFPAAVLIGYPLAFVTGIVEIKHGGNGINTQSINVKLFKPINSVRNEEIHHFTAAEIENVRSPVFMFSGARIFMFIECRTIEPSKSVLIFCEVSGNPVYKHPDSFFVTSINKISQAIRVAKAAGGCKISGNLVAP